MATDPIWKPSTERLKNSNMYKFLAAVNSEYGTNFQGYDELHEWSISNLDKFWARMWETAKIEASSPYSQVIDDDSKMPGARWFLGAKLNFARNLLRYRDDKTAIVFRGEAMERSVRLTYAEIYDRVARLAKSLRREGVTTGDRVAGFMPNMPETVIAMLAAASLGAIWSSCSPDFGTKGVLDRFGQIEPKVLFVANGYSYNGKQLDSLGTVSSILKGLSSHPKVVVVPYTEKERI